MKWAGLTEKEREDRNREWHKHFVLFPCKMRHGGWVWLETVWRREEKPCRPNSLPEWVFDDSIEAPKSWQVEEEERREFTKKNPPPFPSRD